jgi:hypothetical protein
MNPNPLCSGAESVFVGWVCIAIEIAASALEEGRNDLQRAAVEVDPKFADPDRFEAVAAEASKLDDQPWLKVHHENGAEILRVFEWDKTTNTGTWRIPSSHQAEIGIIAESNEEYLRLKNAAPIGEFGFGDDSRKARSEFINEHGVDAYFNRHKVA